MTSSILCHLNELKAEWRRQDFFLSKEQQSQYDILVQARRDQVKEFYKNGKVSKGRKEDS